MQNFIYLHRAILCLAFSLCVRISEGVSQTRAGGTQSNTSDKGELPQGVSSSCQPGICKATQWGWSFWYQHMTLTSGIEMEAYTLCVHWAFHVGGKGLGKKHFLALCTSLRCLFISKVTICLNPLTASGWSEIRQLKWISEISGSDHFRPSVQVCLKSDGQSFRPVRQTVDLGCLCTSHCLMWCFFSDYFSCFLSRLIRWFVAFVLHCFSLFALFVVLKFLSLVSLLFSLSHWAQGLYSVASLLF